MDVKAVAELLGCSQRHIYRLANAGDMPAPVKIGALNRWRRADLEAWLDNGCKPVKKNKHSSLNQRRNKK
jgi:excisionase family DNA binding protein